MQGRRTATRIAMHSVLRAPEWGRAGMRRDFAEKVKGL